MTSTQSDWPVWVRGDPAVLAPRVHEFAKAVDPNAVITMPIPLDEVFEGDWYLLRAFVLGAALLVGVLLSLAASALYAILSLIVSQRTVRSASAWRSAPIAGALPMTWPREQASRLARACCSACRSRALCYEFLQLTGSGRSVPGAVAMASVLGLSVMLLVSLTACRVPTLRALRIAPMDALRSEG